LEQEVVFTFKFRVEPQFLFLNHFSVVVFLIICRESIPAIA